MKRELWLLAIAVGLGACRKESKPEGDKPIPSVAAPRPSLRAPERKPPISMEAIPTEEDFELEAARDITSKNLEEELDRLEKELGAE